MLVEVKNELLAEKKAAPTIVRRLKVHSFLSDEEFLNFAGLIFSRDYQYP